MAAALAGSTRFEIFFNVFSSLTPPDQLEKRRRPDSPMQVVLPVPDDFESRSRGEYLEDLVAQIDAPRLNNVRTAMSRLDALRFSQLTLFIGRAENLRFRRVQVGYTCF